jgi:uncharacterized protein
MKVYLLNICKAMGVLIILIIIAEGINKFSFALADQLSAFLPYQTLDAYGLYLYITVHHVFQLLFSAICIGLIYIVLRKRQPELFLSFGIRWPEHPRKALLTIMAFTAIWAVIQFGLGYYMVAHQWVDASLGYPLNAQTVIGQYFFQLMLSGTSEELLYRSLIIGLTFVMMNKPKPIWLYVFSLIPFLIGHITYQLFPFEIYPPNVLQLVTVFIFGWFYTFLFLRFKSIIPPMIAHGVLNTLIITSGFILSSIV